MAEHGVDFQAYCWYTSEKDAPLRSTQLSSAIHYGHMLAKYSDKVKMALLWEASAGAHLDSDGFRKYIVPYWLEYFFSDDRYMKIGNTAVISVYGSEVLAKDFGGAKKVHEAFDYLRAEVKKLGYDGLIILCYGENCSLYKECGFGYLDAVRRIFMEDIPHTDVVPSEDQKDRICILHPKDRATIAPQDRLPHDENSYGVYKRYEFKTESDLDKWEFCNISSLEIKDGCLVGHSDGANDPHMIPKDKDFLLFEAIDVGFVRANIRTYKPPMDKCCVEFRFAFNSEMIWNKDYLWLLTNPEELTCLEVQRKEIFGILQDRETSIYDRFCALAEKYGSEFDFSLNTLCEIYLSLERLDEK